MSKSYELIPLDVGELEQITLKLLRLIGKKNTMYRDSWQKYGEVASIFANIARKFDRLEAILIHGEAQPEGETLVDTVADLAAYSLMYLWWLSKHRPEQFQKWVQTVEKVVEG